MQSFKKRCEADEQQDQALAMMKLPPEAAAALLLDVTLACGLD